jgi:hypothetical protein
MQTVKYNFSNISSFYGFTAVSIQIVLLWVTTECDTVRVLQQMNPAKHYFPTEVNDVRFHAFMLMSCVLDCNTVHSD